MILDGKAVAAEYAATLKQEIDDAVMSGHRRPRLVIISIGDDPASKVYVRNKMKKAEECGIIATHFPMMADTDEDYIKDIIVKFNNDNNIDGIMVQLPLPSHLDERAIIDTINPAKDVDGLTTTNIGRLRSGQPCIVPCTAKGVIDLLSYYDIDVDGKNVTIVGRSNIVGKPLADLLMSMGATVTQCHSHTRDLEVDTKKADILVSAIGKPKFLNDDYVGFGAVVIDIGINRDEEGKLCGDVDFKDVEWKVQHITPVPGGVGPMTVIELMMNTVGCWKKNAF